MEDIPPEEPLNGLLAHFFIEVRKLNEKSSSQEL